MPTGVPKAVPVGAIGSEKPALVEHLLRSGPALVPGPLQRTGTAERCRP